ncbi:indole-3-glycerol phosphate synthase TrpC [Neobacillus muris]|uniref:indole-3-glycerol phosphate synthase TrpC n=1 Tax=Neobacillus muris TaxID=2941334 RepID=UPI00203FE3DB|nr:indole-3-glycerol phosphate synthase TrpC [Neobacillus muris]
METILDRIIEQKKQEVKALREKGVQQSGRQPVKRSFIESLQRAEDISIIAEYKRASPSKGVINHAVDPREQAAIYEDYGAAAISVLTDQTFFKGSFSDLAAVRETVDLPILCKDFIIDPLQIDQAASYGADIILLIVAALDQPSLQELYQYARNLDLEVLMEVHNQQELDIALKMGAEIIGVNNRDLKTFNVSLEVTEKLAAQIKRSGAFLISESGIHQQSDVRRVQNVGANGILVGEAFMKSSDIKQTFLDFCLPLIEGAKQ